MNYNVYDSSVSSYYQNFMYTNDEWVVFDINDTDTIMLIGSYEVSGTKIVGNTRQVVTISTNNSYSSTPTINIENFDNRADTVSFSSNTSYRMISNIQDAPTQRNTNYETSYRTYDICLTLLIALCIGFTFNFIRGLIVCKR